MTIWICRWRMNMLVTSQYQPRLSSIAKIFSRRISQSDWWIQIKLNYSQMCRSYERNWTKYILYIHTCDNQYWSKWLHNVKELGLWCLTSLSAIFHLYQCRSVLLVEKTGGPGENHRPATSHWQTLSHNVASSTPSLSWSRTHKVSGDM